MKKATAVGLVLCMLLTPVSVCADQPSFWDDAKSAFRLAGKGFKKQFKYGPSRNTLIVGGIATSGIAFADSAILTAMKDVPTFRSNALETIGDEVTFAFSFSPFLTYAISRHTEDAKLREFSLETFSAFTLAFSETVVLSQLPTHRRPRHDRDKDDLGFINDTLRGTYSWPSGHLVGPVILTLKTYDYYGWKWATVPATFTAIATATRIAKEYHYPSDLAGAAALAISAHLVTRHINKNENFLVSASPLPQGGVMLSAKWEF